MPTRAAPPKATTGATTDATAGGGALPRPSVLLPERATERAPERRTANPPGRAVGLAGAALELRGPGAARLAALWRELFELERRPRDPRAPTLRVRLRAGSAAPAPADGREVYRGPELRVLATPEGFFLEGTGSSVALSPGASRAEVALGDAFWRQARFDQRELFSLALLMLLRPHGVYGLHANAVARRGRGALLIGASGAGKSTLTVNLLREGWRLVADDVTLLREGPDHGAGAAEARALRRGVSLTPDTARALPRAENAPAALFRARGKLVLPPEALASGGIAAPCRPALLLFPEILDRDGSGLDPLARPQALIGLMRHSAGLMLDPELSRRQLALLEGLARRAPAFRLRLGRDARRAAPELARRLAKLLDDAATANEAGVASDPTGSMGGTAWPASSSS